MTEKEENKTLDELIMLKHFLQTEDTYNEQERDVNTVYMAINLIKNQQKALKQKDKEIAELRIKQISSNLNNSINKKQKEDEQLQALNEGWKIELEKKDKEISELKADRVEKDKIIDIMLDDLDVNDWGKEALYKSYEKRAISILESE